MKTKKTAVDRRREGILNFIRNRDSITTSELIDNFAVSETTIRRDLNYLQDLGEIDRYYGGAKINKMANSKNLILENKKEKIAKRCADFISDNDDIFINSSSTALMVIKYIKEKRVNIITNNAKASSVEMDPLVNVILTGGKVSFPKNALTGTFALNNLKSVASNITILGISGITDEGELTTSVLDEVEINQYMLNESTDKNILVCDSSKFKRSANFKVGTLKNISVIITDTDIERATLEYIEKLNVKVILV